MYKFRRRRRKRSGRRKGGGRGQKGRSGGIKEQKRLKAPKGKAIMDGSSTQLRWFNAAIKCCCLPFCCA